MSVVLRLKCKKHPQYQGLRRAKNCAACMFIYNLRPMGEGTHDHYCGSLVQPGIVVTQVVSTDA